MNREIFKSIIPDKGIGDYILNGRDINPYSDPFESKLNYSVFFSNTVNLAFMYAFSCYQDYANRNYNPDGDGILDACVKGGNSNSARVLSNMKKIYNGYPITNELIQYILNDIYFDFELGEDDSHLRTIFPNFINTNAGIHLDEIFTVINKSLGSSRSDLKLKEAKNMLSKLLDMFPFMKTTKLVFMPERQWYAFLLNEKDTYSNYARKTVNTFGAITKIQSGTEELYCYLSDVILSDVTGGTLKYVIVGTDNFVLCKLAGENKADNGYSGGVLENPFEIPHDEEFFCSLLCPGRLESIKAAENDYSIEQLFNIKYKYIKNLALAIADTLGRSSTSDNARKFKDEFESDFPEAFKRYDKSVNNWDAVVLMLLIETSPSFVLQKLFSPDSNISISTATTVIKNLKKRFGKEFSESITRILFGKTDGDAGPSPKTTAEALEAKAKELVRINAVSRQVQSYNYLRVDCIAEKMAELILSAISFQSDNEPVSFCIGNSKQNIEALESLRSEPDPAQKCEGVYRAFGDLLVKLTCFYEGIYAYGNVKMSYDNRASARMLSSAEINEYQAAAEKAFSAAALEKYKEIQESCPQGKLKKIIEIFTETCASCHKYDAAKKTFIREHESYMLYSVLGKNDVFRVRRFIEETKELPELDANTVDRWIEEAIKIIGFFRTGSFDGKSNEINLFSAITPFIASYNKGSYNKDGYHTAMFSLVFNTGDTSHRKREVNVLSELTYNMNSKYYCMPNIVTSTNKWWIDPFIIKCQAFDEIFNER